MSARESNEGYSIIENASLRGRNTFGVEARAAMLVEVREPAAIEGLFDSSLLRARPVLVLGEGSKSNHLTYLGDAVIGAKVNVGAGTVTCNYDGVNKSQTHIDDGAFIGSGSMLVAPVRVGARATIGAGSVITRDTPPDKLTLERSKQVTIDGWQRPTKKV